MTILAAVHQIHHTVDEKPVIQKPGTLFDVKDEDVDFLTKAGAVREPEERELLSYQHSKGLLIAAPAAAPVAPVPAAATKPAVAAAAKPAAAAPAAEDNIG